MAGTIGQSVPALIERLRAQPQHFDIRQAVRLLEHAQPGAARLGDGANPGMEALRLRGSLTRSFPPSDIETLLVTQGGRSADLTVTFMTLAGAFGPLPPPLSARVIEQARRHDFSARDFLDIFNHRLLSLLLRQWRLRHPALQGGPQNPAMPARLPPLALLGLATLPAQGAASPEAQLGELMPGLLAAAGLLHRRPLSAHALERLFAAYFGVTARVDPLCGGWLPLDPSQWSQLGRPGAELGGTAVIGQRVWDQSARIRITLGPLGFALMTALLPGGPGHVKAATLLALTVGNTLDIELVLLLRPAEVPSARLARAANGHAGMRLGWTSWLGDRPRRQEGAVRLALTPAACRAEANA
jgi:type VI secretion system protein ImpH